MRPPEAEAAIRAQPRLTLQGVSTDALRRQTRRMQIAREDELLDVPLSLRRARGRRHQQRICCVTGWQRVL
jgi:hypothetical protein